MWVVGNLLIKNITYNNKLGQSYFFGNIHFSIHIPVALGLEFLYLQAKE